LLGEHHSVESFFIFFVPCIKKLHALMMPAVHCTGAACMRRRHTVSSWTPCDHDSAFESWLLGEESITVWRVFLYVRELVARDAFAAKA
jgi:hypothetical protein